MDNQAVVAILNNLTSKSGWVMTPLRSFELASMKYIFFVSRSLGQYSSYLNFS